VLLLRCCGRSGRGSARSAPSRPIARIEAALPQPRRLVLADESVQPRLRGVYVFSRDLARSLRFYRLLGLTIEAVSDVFARAPLPGGTVIEWGTADLTLSYDPHWRAATGPAANTINFELASDDAVDAMYRTLTSAGFVGHLAPCTAPWRARFAIVDDADGNSVGLHGPRDLASDRRRERGHSA